MTRRCWYCGTTLKTGQPQNRPNAFTRDHVVPRLHGSFTFHVDCCARCNTRKGCQSLEDFRVQMFGNSAARFAGERKYIGRPSFVPRTSFLAKSGIPLQHIYAAWFAAAAIMSQRFNSYHDERYYRYAAQ